MTAKIILSKDKKPIQQFELKNESTSIGRKQDNDIAITDPAVSGTHAKVQLIGDNFLIQDMGSTNGVHIKGRRVKQQVLKTGDIISIGVHELQFVIQEGQAKVKDANKAKATSERKSKAASRPGEARPSEARPNEARPGEARPADKTELLSDQKRTKLAAKTVNPVLMVLNGADKDKLIKLDDALTTIGEAGVQVAAVSSRPQGHFIIHVDGGKDKNRTPLVNGEPTGFKSRKLENGDKIEVAGIRMEYLSQ